MVQRFPRMCSSVLGAGMTLLSAGVANAQGIALPEIVVTSPSPILTRRTTPQPPVLSREPVVPRRRQARAPAASAPQPQAPAPPQTAPADPNVPLGVLPVATDVFAPVTVVTRNDIDREPQRSLGDLLAQRPGVSASTYAPGIASRPIIRGLDNFRVRVQENGINVGGVSELGEDHAVPLDPHSADQIEVIRGPATLRYGSTAIGGVVSATNNRIPTFVPANGIVGRISGGVSSVDRGRDGSAAIDAGGGGFAIHTDAFGRQAEDYATPRGRQRNSFVDAHGQSVGGSFIGQNGFIGLAFQHYDALYGIPGVDAAATRTKLDVNQEKLSSRGEYRPDSGPIEAVRFSFGVSRYKHNEIGTDENAVTGVAATFRNREYEARIEAQHVPVSTPFGALTGAFGVQAGRRNIDTTGAAFLRPTETRSFAAYLFEELALTNTLKLQAAGRIERVTVDGTAAVFPDGFLPDPVDPVNPAQAARKREFAPKSASLGLQQRLPYDFVATLNGQYVERAPASPELFSQGPHDATRTFEIGDPTLKREIARTIEAGIRRATGPFRFDATGYYTRYTGFVYKRLTGQQCGDEFVTCGSATELDQVVYTQRNATFYGAELSAQLDVLPVWRGFFGVDGQYDFVRATFDDGTYVPRIPPHRAGAGLYYRDDNLFLRVGFLHAFAHTETSPFETFTPDYTLLKAEVNYIAKLNPAVYGFNEVKVGVIGDNLLNDEVRNSASFRKDEILLPGRNVRAYVTMRF